MISLGYFFITKKGIYTDTEAGRDDPDALKVLAVKDTKSKAVFAHAGPYLLMLGRRKASTASDLQSTALSRTYFG